jgi:serine/threonine protein kinase
MPEGEHVGTTIAGKYRIRRLIGVGGMGSVYEGQHVDLAKKVAVKIIETAAGTSAELAARFRREARAASAVESEGIVQVFDVGRDPQVGLYMVMELLHGEDLEMRLRKQPARRLDPVLVAQIGHQVARALVKAHAARVIHRDLKPANIFLTDRDDGSLRVKILDFGISKLLASEASITTSKEGLLELTQAGVALGTPQYMSPEQAQGLTTVDHRTDVWGLGVVLYEALAGIPAYPELRTYQETIINLLQVKAHPLAQVAPWVPEPLAKVVHDALEHDMGARIQSCALLASRLEEAVPEMVMASTGPFNAVKQIARGMGSSASHVAYRPPGAAGARANAESPVVVKPGRPITLGDDTQVVVRPSDPGVAYTESDPSTTMLADSSRSPDGNGPPKVHVYDSSKPRTPSNDDAPMSTGDPTMFQTPAWVDPNEAVPATVKTGLSLAEIPTNPPARQRMQGVAAGLVTALAVVVVGGSALMFALRAASPEGEGVAGPARAAEVSSAAAAVAQTTVPPVAPVAEAPAATAFPAAPPATGTGAIPAPPATGAAIVTTAMGSTAVQASADASTTTATAETPP